MNNIPRGQGKGYICLKAKLTLGERDRNTVVTLSVRLHNGKGCLRPFANIVYTTFKDIFYKFLTWSTPAGGGGEETRSGTEKRCSHNLQSGHPE